MSKDTLGRSGAMSHDPSAAFYIVKKLVAAAKEERSLRDKHTKNHLPPDCPEGAGA